MKAVVAHALNELSVVDVNLDPPKAGEVLVRMRATGVCHSDLSIINGTIPSPFPTVLGHEGAGVVEAVGEGVTHVAPGDHVMHSFVPQCGECYHCVNDEPYLCTVAKPEGWLLDGTSRVKLDGEPIAVMTFLGNMAEYAVVPAICTAKIAEGRGLQGGRARRLRREHRSGGGASHREGASRLHRGGVRLRWRGARHRSGGAHRGRAASHRRRSIRGEDGAGPRVRRHRARVPPARIRRGRSWR